MSLISAKPALQPLKILRYWAIIVQKRAGRCEKKIGHGEIFFAKRFADTQKLLIFAMLFKSSTERWVSGLNQQFAKLSYGITVPGVRIPLSPPRRIFFDNDCLMGSRFFCVHTPWEHRVVHGLPAQKRAHKKIPAKCTKDTLGGDLS